MLRNSITSRDGSSSIIRFLGCLFVGILMSVQLSSQGVEVRVTNIRNVKGQLYVAFFQCDSSFSAEVPVWKKLYNKSAIKDKTFSFNVPLPPGRYGLTLLDDENGDGKMNYNLIGLPKEGFGFSNYKHKGIRKPKFKQFSFDVEPNQKVAVTVEMCYF